MEINELNELAYSIYLHKKDMSYNAVKYNYKIGPSMSKKLQIFYKQFSFNIQDFLPYDKEQAKMRLIICYFIENKQIPKNPSTKVYDYFITSLLEYKNEFSLFFKKIASNPNLNTVVDIYKMYIKKEIPFYVFFYVLKWGNFDRSEIASELVSYSFKQAYKILLFFKHFDEVWIKEKIELVNKHLSLNSVKLV